MSAFLPALGELTERLLKVSIQASILIALVLLVHGLAGRILAPRVRYALWLLVVARLLLPVSFESGLSLFNFTHAAPAKVFQAVAAASNAAATPAAAHRAPTPTPAKTPASAPTAAASGAVEPAFPLGPPAPFPWWVVLSVVWFAGVIFLLARIIVIPLRLNARLAQHETATPPAVFAILEESKRLSGVNQVLPIVQSRAVESPALLGFIRPWLLLPEGLVAKFTPQELRLVFLHELAHLKRGDIAVNWLATLVQILHWPNPLVWFAFARMRADRELACDELALSFAAEGESRTYGHAIIKLLEGFRRPAVLPGLVGILEDQTQMKRRITMIAQFKKMTRWSAAPAAVVFMLALVTLTDAQTETVPTRGSGLQKNGLGAKILLSGSGIEASGVLSPDESMVGFVQWGPKGGDLVVRDLLTGTVRNLTAGSHSSDYDQVHSWCWSPDSKSIAYAWIGSSTRYSLRTIPSSGGEPRLLHETRGERFAPDDWSRDGRLLVGRALKAEQPVVATLEVATGGLRVLAPVSGGAHFRFSPDGRFVVFDRYEAGNRDVYVLGVAGGELERLTDLAADDGAPVFSADGSHVLFSSNRRGSWDLWSVSFADGRAAGSPSLVKYDFGDHPKRMARPDRLVFNIRAVQSGAFEVSAMTDGDARARPPRELGKSYLGSEVVPSWSPDGTKVAYARAGRPLLLCVRSLAEGTEETYNPGLSAIQGIFWSPDGRTLALRGDAPKGVRGVFLYSLATRAPISAPLGSAGKVYAPPRTYPLGYSPDGSEFNFLVGEEKQRVALEFKTGSVRTVTTPTDRAWLESVHRVPQPLFNYNTTSDGARVAYVEIDRQEQRIIVSDAEPSSKRVIARVSAPADLGAPRLSPDGKKVAYFYWPKEDAPRKELRVCATDGSWNRVVETGGLFIHGAAYPPTWSPDSTRLAVTLNSDVPNQIGVLENLMLGQIPVAK